MVKSLPIEVETISSRYNAEAILVVVTLKVDLLVVQDHITCLVRRPSIVLGRYLVSPTTTL